MPTTSEAGGRWDPLGQGVKLPHRRAFAALGFPLSVASSDPLALDLVARAFPVGAQHTEAGGITLRIIVSDGPACNDQPVYRARGPLLNLAADSRHALVADMDAGDAVLWTTRATMADAPRFVRWWIAGPVLQMLSHRAVTPLHAACVARDGWGWLLCGPSGAGKSVLACAAAKAGMTFVSDDVSYLLRAEPNRILGRPNLLRLERAAVAPIPELERFSTVPDDAPDDRIYELDPARDLGFATAPECRLAGVVLLERRGGEPPAVEPAEAAEALRLLDATLPLAADGVAEAQLANLHTLSAAPCRRLRYAEAADAALLLRDLSETVTPPSQAG